MTTQAYARWLRRIIVAYVLDHERYAGLISDGLKACDERQWALTRRALDDVDGLLAEADGGARDRGVR